MAALEDIRLLLTGLWGWGPYSPTVSNQADCSFGPFGSRMLLHSGFLCVSLSILASSFLEQVSQCGSRRAGSTRCVALGGSGMILVISALWEL